jgi:hypothetical protein
MGRVPATGKRLMCFAARRLPSGIVPDENTGRLTGQAARPGFYWVTKTATNARGSSSREFEIVICDRIALTPTIGWNSWNCFAGAVDAEKVRAQAPAMGPGLSTTAGPSACTQRLVDTLPDRRRATAATVSERDARLGPWRKAPESGVSGARARFMAGAAPAFILRMAF